MTNREIIDATDRTQVGVYARQPVAFVRGKGTRLWDADGKLYLDFFSGLAVNNLGHAHPRILAAIREQSEKLLHASNVYYNEPAALLGTLLTEHSFAERVFFCNSGAEANEAAIGATAATRSSPPTARSTDGRSPRSAPRHRRSIRAAFSRCCRASVTYPSAT
jgi:acetylornithine/succinyldiaminopimelate/putrescine aminotransferase